LEIGGDVCIRSEAFFEAKRSTTFYVSSTLDFVRLRRTFWELGFRGNTHEELLNKWNGKVDYFHLKV
jgi:hypothetical protein